MFFCAVIEIPGDTSVIEAVRILSEHNIRAAPVLNPEPGALADWQGRYLGVIDYSAIIVSILDNDELASVALSAGSATAAGVRMGAVGAVGFLRFCLVRAVRAADSYFTFFVKCATNKISFE